ncbi:MULTISPECIES: glycoside hydrolase family 99-like domain-containing protein [Thiorhodovibrio]|uniref:glycoside hydrolase family 99-like domain-containing protein n=1 Tax=Thiorhodovibrio TaxID=61593 RepID=UPI00191214FB|nr:MULTISPECIES: glycoside hydrolase family 99-like domain-containing protein [Thiorhodovibrio]MBK5971200.1 hypothetical protein [Thiorhodovibrio winogradskyi]WPL14651.1 Rhamnan synthesis protein F [Thiorhodovibrio litoralis]
MNLTNSEGRHRDILHARRTAILVIGMHRSGTSALTRVLNILGADLPTDLMPPVMGNNEIGFWESLGVQGINDRVLESAGSAWDDWQRLPPAWFNSPSVREDFLGKALPLLKHHFGHSAFFVLKDPRISRLLPLWLEALQEFNCDVRCLIPYRNPLEVSASLRARDGFPSTKSHLIWLRYVLDAELSSRQVPRAIVTYDNLLDDWPSTLDALSQKLDLVWPRWSPTTKDQIEKFLSSSHRHHSIPNEVIFDQPHLSPWVKDTHAGFCELASDQTESIASIKLDAVRQEFDRASDSIGTVFNFEKETMDAHLADLRLRKEELELSNVGHESHITQLQGQVADLVNKVQDLSAHLSSVQIEARDATSLKLDLLTKLDAIQSTAAWQLAAPVRYAENRFPRFVRLLAALPKLVWWTLSSKLPQRLRLRKAAAVLLKRGLFDRKWYVENNPDVLLQGQDPLIHWLIFGWREGRRPTPEPDSDWFVSLNSEMASNGHNPLVTYLLNDREAEKSERKSTSAPVGGGLPRLYSQMLATADRNSFNADHVAEPDAGLDSSLFNVKLIAFYLPQFHPIPENDEWWGKGFTEWTNVTKAVPQFEGHYQPQLPGELGFYDLRLSEVLHRQVALAIQHGLSGFCFHYYWFAGRRLLEKPLNQFTSDKSIKFEFCICWANENWTRRWDGQESEILLAQEHSPATDEKFIDDVVPLFQDPRYITISGRPVLIVYRIDLLPEPKLTVKRWRTRCRELGLPEPYLIAARTFGLKDPRPHGFDAAVEFPPHNVDVLDITKSTALLNPAFQGRIFSYPSLVSKQVVPKPSEPCRIFGCAFPGWDNEARKPGKGHVFWGATPRLYSEWLDKLCRDAGARSVSDERIVFVNAWNEWAEGAHLEPDRRFGYAYLRATAQVLRKHVSATSGLSGGINWLSGEPVYREAEIAVVVHVFQLDTWKHIAEKLVHIPERFDLFITLVDEDGVDLVRNNLPDNVRQCFLGVTPNRGRDIEPFLHCLPSIYNLGYEIALKVHAKGNTTQKNGIDWGLDLIGKALGSTKAAKGIINLMRARQGIGLVSPTGHLLPIEYFWGSAEDAELNRRNFERLASQAALPRLTKGFSFPAGSVYWFRPRAFHALTTISISDGTFPSEGGQRDGTPAHAVERLVGLAASTDGWSTEVTKTANPFEESTSWLMGIERGTYPFAHPTFDAIPYSHPVQGIR